MNNMLHPEQLKQIAVAHDIQLEQRAIRRRQIAEAKRALSAQPAAGATRGGVLSLLRRAAGRSRAGRDARPASPLAGATKS